MLSLRRRILLMVSAFALLAANGLYAQQQDAVPRRQTQQPPLHATQWLALTGKPLGAEAGAMIFQQGGNAIDAACAMLAAVSTMWDTLSWGGETQALIYNPH